VRDEWCEGGWWGVQKLECGFTMVDGSAPCEKCEVGSMNEGLGAGEGEGVVIDRYLFDCGKC